eukprot:GHVU01216479.1.p2 GENE.GHVU01216479.1~~GHVU01216479.1.p2  ORF type:complete len:262 (-),score=23.09 GHVU01216479.1:213-998(-)
MSFATLQALVPQTHVDAIVPLSYPRLTTTASCTTGRGGRHSRTGGQSRASAGHVEGEGRQRGKYCHHGCHHSQGRDDLEDSGELLPPTADVLCCVQSAFYSLYRVEEDRQSHRTPVQVSHPPQGYGGPPRSAGQTPTPKEGPPSLVLRFLAHHSFSAPPLCVAPVRIGPLSPDRGAPELSLMYAAFQGYKAATFIFDFETNSLKATSLHSYDISSPFPVPTLPQDSKVIARRNKLDSSSLVVSHVSLGSLIILPLTYTRVP